MANRISVFEGAIETIRCAGWLSVTVRPSPSVSVMVVGVGGTVAVAGTGVVLGADVGAGVAAGAHPNNRKVSRVKANIFRYMFFS
jgi:hypothetical protein